MRWDERWNTDNGNAWRARFTCPNMSYIRYSQSGPKERRNSGTTSTCVLRFTYMAQSASSRASTRLARCVRCNRFSAHLLRTHATGWYYLKRKEAERKRGREWETRGEEKDYGCMSGGQVNGPVRLLRLSRNPLQYAIRLLFFPLSSYGLFRLVAYIALDHDINPEDRKLLKHLR